jgi:hypothetical protein
MLRKGRFSLVLRLGELPEKKLKKRRTASREVSRQPPESGALSPLHGILTVSGLLPVRGYKYPVFRP